MPVTQIVQFNATLPVRGQSPEVFATNANAAWVEFETVINTELSAAFTQLNALETNVNAKEVSATNQVSLAANQVALATTEANNAATSAATAYATANFKGAWNSITDFGGASCIYNGIVYLSLLSPNVNHQPNISPIYFSPLTQALPIDETLSHLSTTAATVNIDGTLATMTYAGGYKTLYTYTTGNLIKVEYTDTNGITVLLTETISYTVDGIPLITRS